MNRKGDADFMHYTFVVALGIVIMVTLLATKEEILNPVSGQLSKSIQIREVTSLDKKGSDAKSATGGSVTPATLTILDETDCIWYDNSNIYIKWKNSDELEIIPTGNTYVGIDCNTCSSTSCQGAILTGENTYNFLITSSEIKYLS